MLTQRHCWWCGFTADVDASLPESNGLTRDDIRTFAGEAWICTDNSACGERATERFAS